MSTLCWSRWHGTFLLSIAGNGVFTGEACHAAADATTIAPLPPPLTSQGLRRKERRRGKESRMSKGKNDKRDEESSAYTGSLLYLALLTLTIAIILRNQQYSEDTTDV